MLIVRTCHTDWETDIPSGRVVIEESKPAGRFAAGHPVIRRLPVPAIPCNGSREAVYSPRKETEMTEALIVIDVQNDFCPGGALAVPGGDEIVAGINERMAAFETVILTQDWRDQTPDNGWPRHGFLRQLFGTGCCEAGIRGDGRTVALPRHRPGRIATGRDGGDAGSGGGRALMASACAHGSDHCLPRSSGERRLGQPARPRCRPSYLPLASGPSFLF